MYRWPIAHLLATLPMRKSNLLMILVLLPFWTSLLVRTSAWIVLLQSKGVVNDSLHWLGIIDEPLTFILYNVNSIVITLAHAYAPFAILPIYVALEKIDRSLLEAGRDLGESRLMTFWRVTLPLAMPADHLSPGDRVGVYLPGREEPVVRSARFRGGDEDAAGRSVARITLRDNDIGAILRQMGVDGPTQGGFVLVRHG